MNIILQPSLEHITLVQIVVTLWNQDDVRDLLTEFCQRNHSPDNLSFESSTEWQNIENRVIKKIPLLLLPEILKERLNSFIKPIGLQIFNWMKHHCIGEPLDKLYEGLPHELCWIPQGTINRKKTAEILIKDENLDITKRYKLACIYCLEEDILALWNRIPDHVRQRNLHAFSPIRSHQFILTHWTFLLQESNMTSLPVAHLFELCAKNSEKETVQYFLQKLNPIEKERSITTAAMVTNNNDVLFLLISEMEEEQQIEIFQNKTYQVLRLFLEWPLQCFFIEAADRMWSFLSKEHFRKLLLDILTKIKNGYEDCNYKNLFRKFWQKSPDALKIYIIGCRIFLRTVLFEQDIGNLTLFLGDLNEEVKRELIYKNQDLCEVLVEDGKWDVFGKFMKECLHLKEERIIFKNAFEHRIQRSFCYDTFTRNRRKWDELFLLSDDVECKKRESIEGSESHCFKKLC